MTAHTKGLTDEQLRDSPVPVTANQGTSPWVSGLDAPTLSALELTGVKGCDGSTIASEENPFPVSMGQILDANNTKTITSADASPGSPWQGTATATRENAIVGIFLSVVSSTAISGTYTFEFGEDGVTWPISISLPSNDFSTIRFRQLLNVGAYYRASFEPDAPLGATVVALTSQLARQVDGPFVVPSDHVFDEDDAAFGVGFSFPKAYDPFTRQSVNVRPDAVSKTPTPAVSPLSGAAVYLSDAIDTSGFSSLRLLIATDEISAAAGVTLEWSDTSTFTVVRTYDPDSYTQADADFGSTTYDYVTKARYVRLRYTNGSTLQGSFFVEFQFNSAPFLEETRLKTLSAPRTSQTTVTVTAAEVVTPLTGRRAITLKNVSTSSRSLFYGFSSGVTTSTGMELAAGDFIDRDYDDSVRIWVIQAGGSGTVTACVEESL